MSEIPRATEYFTADSDALAYDEPGVATVSLEAVARELGWIELESPTLKAARFAVLCDTTLTSDERKVLCVAYVEAAEQSYYAPEVQDRVDRLEINQGISLCIASMLYAAHDIAECIRELRSVLADIEISKEYTHRAYVQSALAACYAQLESPPVKLAPAS